MDPTVAGIVVGSLLLLAVAIQLLVRGEMPHGGVILALVGMILVGMSVWVRINVSFGSEGLQIALQSASEIAEEVEALGASVEGLQAQLDSLTGAMVATATGEDLLRLQGIQAEVRRLPTVDRRSLATTITRLDSLASAQAE
jgi:hypothetical protein